MYDIKKMCYALAIFLRTLRTLRFALAFTRFTFALTSFFLIFTLLFTFALTLAFLTALGISLTPL